MAGIARKLVYILHLSTSYELEITATQYDNINSISFHVDMGNMDTLVL